MGAVNSERVSGIDTYILYKAQPVYDTVVVPDTIFGGLITSSSFDVDRQYTEKTGFVGVNAYDGRATNQQLAGTLSTSAQVEFDVQRWDWLEYVLLADRTGSGTTGVPYSYTVGKDKKTMTITEEIDNDATDSARAHTMHVNSMNLKCGVGESVSVSLGLIGGRLDEQTSVQSKVAYLTDEVYNFSGGIITIAGNAYNNIIDNVSLDINNNFTVLYGFNEQAQNARPGKLNVSFKVTAKYLDDTQLNLLLAKTVVDVTLRFNKGDDKYVLFTMKDVVLNRMSSSHQLNEFMVEETDVLPRRIIVTEVV